MPRRALLRIAAFAGTEKEFAKHSSAREGGQSASAPHSEGIMLSIDTWASAKPGIAKRHS